MRRCARIAIFAASTFALGCPSLLPGSDLNEAGVEDARAGEDSGESIDADELVADTGVSTRDATTTIDGDVIEADANPSDPDATTMTEEDATTVIDDAGTIDDDAGMMCSPLFGQPCTITGVCGSTYDCAGNCTGGTAAPVCPCGVPMCAGNTWVCTGGCCDPLSGQACDRPGYCGAVYDCAAACVGGSPPPSCPCGAATCDVTSGQWSACPGSPMYGAPCTSPDRCGGAIACDGTCQGGTMRPPCVCNTQMCLANGTWTACTDPPNLGSDCAAGGRCGGTIQCNGSCLGGTLPPACSCATLTCLGFGQWSSCPDPSNLGTSCDTMTSCGGAIQCDGSCAGGTPLPTCQCGTPTCSGCSGGSCGANSVCSGGACVCSVNDCSCGGAIGVACFACNTDLGACNVDDYGCGQFVATQSCPFGCDPMTLTCNCAPDTGFYCSAGTCFCSCGDFERAGEIQCDGSCSPVEFCGPLCRDICGL